MSNKINEEKYYDISLLFDSIKLTTGLDTNQLFHYFNRINSKKSIINMMKNNMIHSLYILNNLDFSDDYIRKIALFYGIKCESGNYKILGKFLNILIYNISNNFYTCQKLISKSNKVYSKKKTSKF